jgi:hypothetical protein
VLARAGAFPLEPFSQPLLVNLKRIPSFLIFVLHLHVSRKYRNGMAKVKIL